MSHIQILVFVLSLITLITNSIILTYFLCVIIKSGRGNKNNRNVYMINDLESVEKAPSYEETLINDDFFD